MTAIRVAMLVCAMVLLAGPGSLRASAQSLTTAERDQAFRQANAAYDRATEAMASDTDAARLALEEAIGLYRRLIAEGADGWQVRYNLGNAYLLAGEPGRAIVQYLGASRQSPRNRQIAENLALARDRVRAAQGPTPPAHWSDRLRPTLALLPARWRFAVALIGIGLAWLLASWRALGAGRGPSWTMIAACAAGGVISAGTLAAETAIDRLRPVGVVVMPDVIGREGPDDLAFEATAGGPLPAGTEFLVLEIRGTWGQVQMGNDRRTWLPRSTWEPVP